MVRVNLTKLNVVDSFKTEKKSNDYAKVKIQNEKIQKKNIKKFLIG